MAAWQVQAMCIAIVVLVSACSAARPSQFDQRDPTGAKATSPTTAAPRGPGCRPAAQGSSAPQGSWFPVSTPALAIRSNLGAATGCDGRIYLIGGQPNGGPLAVYSPGTDTWATAPPMPTPRYELAVTAGLDGRLYAIGGLSSRGDQSLVEVYTPSTATWSEVAPMPTARRGSFAATTGADGRIYVIGGFSHSRAVEVYSPDHNGWSEAAPLPSGRWSLAAVTAADGRIYAIGGFDDHGVLNRVDVYTPNSNSWSPASPLPYRRWKLAAAVASDGDIYAIGGKVDANISSATTQVYSPKSNSWSLGPEMTTPRSDLATSMGADGRIYAIGGNGVEGYAMEALATQPPVRPSPAAAAAANAQCSRGPFMSLAGGHDTWTVSDGPPVATVYSGVTVDCDGLIYVIGGAASVGQSQGISDTNLVQAYDSKVSKWRTTAPLPTVRSTLAAATDLQGYVYAIGGIQNDLPGGSLNLSNEIRLTTVERFDPGSHSWKRLSPMQVSLSGFAAFVEPDGSIYAIGADATEVYTPATDSWRQEAAMPTQVWGFGAASGPDGRIYVIGGRTTGNGCMATNAVQVYTPSSNAWSTAAPMPTARCDLAAAAAADGRIYAFGGFGGNPATGLTTVEAYSPATNTWATVTAMPAARADAAAVTGRDGRLYIVGEPMYIYTP